MQRKRAFLTVVALILASGTAAAQAQRPTAQPAQPPQQAQPAPQPAQQPVGQPLLVVPAQPAPSALPEVRINPELPTVELAPLLERVQRQANKQFLLDPRIGPRIYLGGVEPNDVTYPVLLSIFRNLGFAAFEANGRVNIVPDAAIRFYAPVVQNDDASIAPDEWITRVVAINNVEAAFLIPILRPMLPQAAHLAAMTTSNRIVIMDRYANVQRITEVIRSLDVATPARN